MTGLRTLAGLPTEGAGYRGRRRQPTPAAYDAFDPFDPFDAFDARKTAAGQDVDLARRWAQFLAGSGFTQSATKTKRPSQNLSGS
jgi:hypothetical protein